MEILNMSFLIKAAIFIGLLLALPLVGQIFDFLMNPSDWFKKEVTVARISDSDRAGYLEMSHNELREMDKQIDRDFYSSQPFDIDDIS